MSLNLEQYVPEFHAQNVNGERLLQLDSSKLKVICLMVLEIKFRILFVTRKYVVMENTRLERTEEAQSSNNE